MQGGSERRQMVDAAPGKIGEETLKDA